MKNTSILIQQLQAWYVGECDGDWEHSFGIKVETLDNPGWMVTIDLAETVWEHLDIERQFEERSESDWVQHEVSNRQFKGYGGPENLEELLHLFFSLVGTPQTTISLNDLFRTAMNPPHEWGEPDVMRVLGLLQGPQCTIDWEPGDEEWGRALNSDNRVFAYVCARVPLGVALESVDPERMATNVVWLRTASMDAPVFSVDRTLLEEIFGREMSEYLDYSELCINDLVVVSIS